MKSFRFLSLMVALPISMSVLTSTAWAQDPGLGRHKPPTNGGGGGGNPPSNPPRNDPPRNDPPRNDPPRNDPSRSEPNRSDPQNSGGNGGLDRGRDRGPRNDPNSGSGRQNPPSSDRQGRNNDTSRNSDRGPERTRGGNGPSRSGDVRYGTVNNATRSLPPVSPNQFSYGNNGGRLPSQVSRKEQAFSIDNGFRYGYYHYNRNWRDDNFHYGYYNFAPAPYATVYYSPWYSYSFLPAYLSPSRCIIVRNYRPSWEWYDGIVFNIRIGSNSRWDNDDRFSPDRVQRDEVRNATEDLIDVFEKNDRRAMNRLVPQSGNIAIYKDNRYSYSLNADDFYDMLNDLATNAKTDRYNVLEVRYKRNSVRISTRHEYTDPWGNRQDVYHEILLEQDRRNGYVIREFGTSDRRIW